MIDLPIPAFDHARVLIVGDVMLDRYWYGPTARISPEAPVPVVRIAEREERPGGAANVALNTASLGAHAAIIGLVGADEAGQALSTRLGRAGIDCQLKQVPHHPTICKLRILSRRQQLIRLDFERPFTHIEREGLDTLAIDTLAHHDVLVLSDYAKGTLGGTADLIAAARATGKPVLVDPKGRDFARYRGAHLLTPNLAEFEAEAGICSDEDDLIRRAQRMIEELDLGGLLITRGESGMTLVPRLEEPVNFPAHAHEVYDVTGAGDTVVSILAAALAADTDLIRAAGLANLAASLVVSKVGTASVTLAELRAAGGTTGNRRGVTSAPTLGAILEDARQRGERIVMTNGCFDLLHAGHVAYLAEARALGDRLVVAVNDDDSVRRVKGADRPLNTIAQRMAVLAGLASVDWVVPFSEDTPASLVEQLRPDVLVKGGDYRPEDVAGGDYVKRNGGEVVILRFVDGESTTGLIDRIRRT